MNLFHYSPLIHLQPEGAETGKPEGSWGAVQIVTTFTVDPGARVLWCLRRRASDVRCVAFVGPTVVEVQVLQERDLVLRELFPTESAALGWADEYRARLTQQGWHDSPDQRSPSSAA